jgi:hypothetical protein
MCTCDNVPDLPSQTFLCGHSAESVLHYYNLILTLNQLTNMHMFWERLTKIGLHVVLTTIT